MSHFTKVKTHLKEQRLIEKALKAMGFEVVHDPQGVDVRGFFGETQRADFKALTQSKYDIGFRKNENGDYELLADWSLMPKVAEVEEVSFSNHLKREYAKAAIEEIAAQGGLDVQAIEAEDGSIEMVVTQW